MDDEKKQRVLSLFREVKRVRAEAEKEKKRKAPNGSGHGGTTIIGSTIVVCGESAQALVAELLAEQKRRPRTTG